MQAKHQEFSNTKFVTEDPQAVKTETDETIDNLCDEDSKESNETIMPCNGNDFLKRYSNF